MSQYEYAVPERPRRAVKVTHLVIGLIYLGIVATWALAQTGTIDWGAQPYVVPVILVVAGAAGLVAALANSRRRTGISYEHAAPSSTTEPVPHDDTWHAAPYETDNTRSDDE